MKFAEYKGLDLPKVSEEVLDFWKDKQIFEKSVSTREGKESYVFYEGPPSANGMPGIHHVMARTIKDIFPRYKTMKGFMHIDKDLPDIQESIEKFIKQVNLNMYDTFEDIIAEGTYKDAIAYFLALLETVRWGIVRAEQTKFDGSIIIKKNEI